MPPSLTNEQIEIVNLPLGRWLITAPPGCGKTEVLTNRVEHLLQLSSRPNSRILVLTFTRRAADNVIDRIARTLPEHAARVVANRFHQFCHEVLRQQAPERVRTLYEGKAERVLALRAALAEEGLDSPSGSIETDLSQIEFAKKTLAFEQPAGIPDDRLRAAFDAYRRYQERERICDFDDLILDTLEIFRARDWRVEAYRKLYGSVLVDEAQDLNASQYALLGTLAGPPSSDLMLFADHKQSIFAFNGSDLGLLDRFVDEHGAGKRSLTLSFRCSKQVVAAANVLAKALQRTPEVLRDDASLAEGSVEIQELGSEAAEAEWVSGRIAALIAGGLPPNVCHLGERLELAPSEVAVLGRSRRSLTAIEEELRRRLGTVVTSYGQEDLMGSNPGRMAAWLLRAIAHPADAIIRGQLLGAKRSSARSAASLDDAVRLIMDEKQAASTALAQAWLETRDGPGLIPAIIGALEAVVAIEESEEREALLSDINWFQRTRAQLRRTLQREPTPSEFTQEMSLSASTPIQGPGVRVLTMHAAKGQEFRVVAIVGLREGSFPSSFATTPKALQEERRLAYVATTRASRVLLFSRSKTWVTSYGNVRTAARSPFFAEIAESLAVDRKDSPLLPHSRP